MNFSEKPERKKIQIEGGGEASLSPKEMEAHEEVERRRRILERGEEQEVKEPTVERTVSELTDEERELLAELVPDEQTRANLSPEIIEFLLRTKKEEREERKEAA